MVHREMMALREGEEVFHVRLASQRAVRVPRGERPLGRKTYKQRQTHNKAATWENTEPHGLEGLLTRIVLVWPATNTG